MTKNDIESKNKSMVAIADNNCKVEFCLLLLMSLYTQLLYIWFFLISVFIIVA